MDTLQDDDKDRTQRGCRPATCRHFPVARMLRAWFAPASNSLLYQVAGYRRRRRRRQSAAKAANDQPPPAEEQLTAAQSSEDVDPDINIRQRSLGDLDDEIARLESELAQLSDGDEDLPGGAQNDKDIKVPEEPSSRKKQKRDSSEAAITAKENDDDKNLPLRCEICGVNVTSQQLMREHIRGKKHVIAARAIAAKAEGRYCEVCTSELATGRVFGLSVSC